ncbi:MULTISPECIES: tripartite tricarboxylate transporter permease [unclassified Halanaerobium]|uniref:tripartite tricarboxylate transporter permease n=1 Tax=unclassified Halanaerobium TaxID=2641197 RepID=UPI000E116C6B|nr:MULTISPECIES: tripartite tricarboxylate transporter permease [unclassified Halanaerobium]RCW48621.1 putative tricarboxylic transport membrane protein [Halanaerobium sp. MA284_MarDTE_T2]RCW78680.1 putative tricarboxylic transport membrane protein [Halanaerobium sp. DL-01]
MIMDNILFGLTNVIQPFNLLLIALGTSIGLFVGSMPGLSATMAIAILLPLTFGLDPASGISMLASLYMGAMYGGSIAAILLKTPGTPAAAATIMDGYPMAQKGYPGKAFGISLTSSFIGGMISALVLLTIAPLLGKLALEFGPVELFAVAVLGMTIIGSLVRGSTVLGLLSGSIGLLLALIGMDPTTGTPRFTFGNMYLFSGIPFVVALIGLFSIPQAIHLIEQKSAMNSGEINPIEDKMLPTFKEFKKLIVTILRSSGIGVITGLIPGTGGDTACWFAYNEAKRWAKDKTGFGQGRPEGIASAEAANNAVVGGALIPTLTLGIPGSSSTAVLIGGLMVHGILPGPTLMTEHADVTYTLIWGLFFANIFMFIIGLMFTRATIYVTKIDNKVIAPLIVVLAVVGSFAINNSFFDVILMFIFGILGYFMNKIDMPTAPMVIGLILGHMFDTSLNQSLLMSRGSWMIFLRSPISAILLALALFSALQSTPLFGLIIKTFRKKVLNNN